MQHGTVSHSTAQYRTAWQGTGSAQVGHRHGTAAHGTARHLTALHGAALLSGTELMMSQAKLSWDLVRTMKLRATTQKKAKEDIKEKLDRSSSNGRRRCPSETA